MTVRFTLQLKSSMQDQRRSRRMFESKKVHHLKNRTIALAMRVIRVDQKVRHREETEAQMTAESQAVLGAVSVKKRGAVIRQKSRIEDKNKNQRTLVVKI